MADIMPDTEQPVGAPLQKPIAVGDYFAVREGWDGTICLVWVVLIAHTGLFVSFRDGGKTVYWPSLEEQGWEVVSGDSFDAPDAEAGLA